MKTFLTEFFFMDLTFKDETLQCLWGWNLGRFQNNLPFLNHRWHMGAANKQWGLGTVHLRKSSGTYLSSWSQNTKRNTKPWESGPDPTENRWPDTQTHTLRRWDMNTYGMQKQTHRWHTEKGTIIYIYPLAKESTHTHTHKCRQVIWLHTTYKKYNTYTEGLVCHGNTMWGMISLHLFNIKLQSWSLFSQLEAPTRRKRGGKTER